MVESVESKDGLMLTAVEAVSRTDVLLTTPVDSMTFDETATVWSLLDGMEKVIKSRKAELRARLLEDVKRDGADTKNGSKRLKAWNGSGHVDRQARHGKPSLQADKLREVLEARGIALEDAGEVTWKPSAAKVDALLEADRLKWSEVKACQVEGKTTFALKVSPPAEIKDAIALLKP